MLLADSSLVEQIKQAKLDREILLFKDYKTPNISWEEMMIYLYEQYAVKDEALYLRELSQPGNFVAAGSVQTQSDMWLAPQRKHLFDRFEQVAEVLYEANGDKEDRTCNYYNPVVNNCACDMFWHSQGIRLALGNHIVSDHNDPVDVLYWQLLGTAYWQMNNDKVYTLNPGDLLYFSKEDSHKVWQDGPRAGLIMDGFSWRNLAPGLEG